MAIEAHDSAAGLCRATIVGQIELLLGKRRHQEPQPVELLRVQQAVEQLIVIFDRDQFSVRDVAEIGPRREVNRRRELGEKVLGQIVRQVEPIEIAALLLQHFLDMKFRKDHAPFGMMRMGERIEAGGKQVLLANFVRRHAGKLVPACAGRQFGADAFLQGLGAVHLRRRRRMVGQVVPLGEQVELPFHHGRLVSLHLRLHLVERLGHHHGGKAVGRSVGRGHGAVRKSQESGRRDDGRGGREASQDNKALRHRCILLAWVGRRSGERPHVHAGGGNAVVPANSPEFAGYRAVVYK